MNYDVEDMILEGDCSDCDRDPVQCLHCGKCYYEELYGNKGE